MTRCRTCQTEWSGMTLEHCTVCHKTFTSTVAGDRHQVGNYAGLPRRRCLTSLEMERRGMGQNKRGHWVSRRQDVQSQPSQYELESPGSNPGTQPPTEQV